MGRLFLKLYSIIVLAGIVFFIGAFNLETIIGGTLTYHYANLSQGTYFLLEKRLGETPEAQWPQLIAEVNQGAITIPGAPVVNNHSMQLLQQVNQVVTFILMARSM